MVVLTEVKNCLTRNLKNYSVRARGSGGKPIERRHGEWSWLESALPINYVITHDVATHGPLHVRHAYRNAGKIDHTSTTSHHGDQNWPPCGEHDIANRVGHGVAQSRQVAIRLFLDAKRRSFRAATNTQHDDGVHLQHITTEQDDTACGRIAITMPTKTRLIPDFCSSKSLGPRSNYAGHEDGQTHGVEDHVADPGIRPRSDEPCAQPAEY